MKTSFLSAQLLKFHKPLLILAQSTGHPPHTHSLIVLQNKAVVIRIANSSANSCGLGLSLARLGEVPTSANSGQNG